MPGERARPEVGAIHVDAPEFVQTVWRIGDGVEVFSETSRSDKVVDFAVVCEDLVKARMDGFWVGDVGEVRCDFGMAATYQYLKFARSWMLKEKKLHLGARVLLLEMLHKQISLTLSLIL